MRMCYTPRLDIGDPSHPPPRGTAKPAIPHAGLKGIANPCWPMHDWLVSLCLPPLHPDSEPLVCTGLRADSRRALGVAAPAAPSAARSSSGICCAPTSIILELGKCCSKPRTIPIAQHDVVRGERIEQA